MDSYRVDMEKTCPHLSRCLDYSRLYAQYRALMEENYLLKQALRELSKHFKVPEQVEKILGPEAPEEYEPWAERSRKFQAVKTLVLNVVVDQFRRCGSPIHYSRVWEVFKVKYPSIRFRDKGIETIGRICRMLRQDGYLASPRQGYYMPGPKLISEEQSRLQV